MAPIRAGRQQLALSGNTSVRLVNVDLALIAGATKCIPAVSRTPGSNYVSLHAIYATGFFSSRFFQFQVTQTPVSLTTAVKDHHASTGVREG